MVPIDNILQNHVYLVQVKKFLKATHYDERFESGDVETGDQQVWQQWRGAAKAILAAHGIGIV